MLRLARRRGSARKRYRMPVVATWAAVDFGVWCATVAAFDSCQKAKPQNSINPKPQKPESPKALKT